MEVMNVAVSENTDTMAEFFAHMKCLLQGYDAGTREYQRYFEQYKQQFLEEAFLLSFTPSGEIKANPMPKRLKSEIGLEKLIAKHFKGSKEEAEILLNQIHGALNNLSSAFMQIRLGKTVKERFGKKSDLVYKKGAGRSQMEVEKTRYLALMTASLVYGHFYKFLDQDISQWQNAMENAFDQVGIDNKVSSMKDEKKRSLFAKLFFNIGKGE